MATYPPLASVEIPITEQPLSLNIPDMPSPVMGGGPQRIPIPEGYPPNPHGEVADSGDMKPPAYTPPIQQQPQSRRLSNLQAELPPPDERRGFMKFASTILHHLNPISSGNSEMISIHEPPPKPPLMPVGPKPGIPEGLELLADLDTIIVKHHAQLVDVMAGYETANRFNIINSQGERLYFAGEDTDIGTLCCGGPHRPFHFTVIDYSGRTVLILERPCDKVLYATNCWICCGCWLGVMGGSISVKLADGTLLGEITHKYACYKPKYEVRDAEGDLVMRISGNQCGDCFVCQTGMDQCCESVYPIKLKDGTQVGSFKKKWTSLREYFSDYDTFGAEITEELDVKSKALLLGAAFLLDFMYHDPKSQSRIYFN